MRIDMTKKQISSFLSVDKDLEIIIGSLLEHKELKKMLFYNTKDCLSLPSLTEEETQSLIGKNIRIVPKITVEKEALCYILISFDNFIPNENNPEFRDNVISFDIICNIDIWDLGDFKLRPYKVAGAIDGMFNEAYLTGIGRLTFIGANPIIINDQLAGLSMYYHAVHGEEDKEVKIVNKHG